jgi:hypothetical protein
VAGDRRDSIGLPSSTVCSSDLRILVHVVDAHEREERIRRLHSDDCGWVPSGSRVLRVSVHTRCAGRTHNAACATLNWRPTGGEWDVLLTVAGFIPILVALWAIVLEFALVAVGTPNHLGVAESAVAIVAADRILAYVREKTSHELAKVIPLTLALSLLIGGLAQLEDNLRVIVDGPFRSDLTVEMVAFLVALEVGLRLANDAVRGVVAAVTKRGQGASAPPDHGDA